MGKRKRTKRNKSNMKQKNVIDISTKKYVDENQRIYQEIYKADDYDIEAVSKNEGFFKDMYNVRLSRLLALAKDKKVLDIGCGSGAYLVPLLEAGIDVYGIDYAEQFVEKTKTFMKKEDLHRIVHGDATDMRRIYQDNSFDMAYSISTLQYISKRTELLSELNRILKNGSIAVLEFGNTNSMNAVKLRTATKLRAFDSEINRIISDLEYAGFLVAAIRMGQMFPMYTEPGDSETYVMCSAFLRKYMSRKVSESVLLDEAVAASAISYNFGYKMFVIAIKSEDRSNIKKFVPDLIMGDPSKWQSKQVNFDFDAMKKDPKNFIGRFCQCLIVNPTDCMAVYGLMRLHGDEYIPIAEKYLNDVRKTYGHDVALLDERSVSTQPEMNTAMKDFVSVVLPTYNAVHMLPEIINSLNRQTLNNFELIIVNDGSTDETKQYLDNLKMREGITLKIVHQMNMKLPGALNVGFLKTTGEYLTWVSSDCVCHPIMLWKLATVLQNCPTAGMAYGAFLIVDQEGTINNKIYNQDMSTRSLIIRNPGNAAFMYTKLAAQTIGIYDERLIGAEDWDYWLRMSLKFSFIGIEDILYYYREHDSSMQSTIRHEIDEATEGVIMKFIRESGGKLDLRFFYPSINHTMHGDGMRRMILEAQLDFSARCLTARTKFMVGFASTLLDELSKENEKLDGYAELRVHAHQCIVQLSKGDADKALDFAEKALKSANRMNIKNNQDALRYANVLGKFVETKNPSAMQGITPLLGSDYAPLFQHDKNIFVE